MIRMPSTADAFTIRVSNGPVRAFCGWSRAFAGLGVHVRVVSESRAAFLTYDHIRQMARGVLWRRWGGDLRFTENTLACCVG